MSFRIEVLSAWTQVDADDEEGVIVVLMPNGLWMPLMGGEPLRTEAMRPHAIQFAQLSGRPVHLRRFVAGLTQETINP